MKIFYEKRPDFVYTASFQPMIANTAVDNSIIKSTINDDAGADFVSNICVIVVSDTTYCVMPIAQRCAVA